MCYLEISPSSSKLEQWSLSKFVKPSVQNEVLQPIAPEPPPSNIIHVKNEPQLLNDDTQQELPYHHIDNNVSNKLYEQRQSNNFDYQNNDDDSSKLIKDEPIISPNNSPDKLLSDTFESDEIDSVLAEATQITGIKPVSSFSGETIHFSAYFNTVNSC